MATTLQEILIGVNAYTDLEASVPTGTDLTTKVEFSKQAVREWANAYQWPELSRKYEVLGTSATLTLPSDFAEFESAPQQLNGGSWLEFPEVLQRDIYGKGESDRYCYLTGDKASGFIAVFNYLDASATLSIVYQAQPSLMATLSDTCIVPDPDFVKTKVISYVLQSRSDDRFPTVNSDAARLLQNMIGRSQSTPKGGINKMRHNTTFRLE